MFILEEGTCMGRVSYEMLTLMIFADQVSKCFLFLFMHMIMARLGFYARSGQDV